MKGDKNKALFRKSRYNGLNIYHVAPRTTDSHRGFLPFIKTAFLAGIAYLLWIAIHEFIHYYVCALLGGAGSLSSILPNPIVTCRLLKPMSDVESFFYTLSPYLAGISVIVIISRLVDRFMKYLAYAALFDLMYNLVVTTVFWTVLDGKKNDLMYFFEGLKIAGAETLTVYLFMVSFIVLLSIVVFYRGGYVHHLREENYRNAVFVFLVIYAGNLATLYLA